MELVENDAQFSSFEAFAYLSFLANIELVETERLHVTHLVHANHFANALHFDQHFVAFLEVQVREEERDLLAGRESEVLIAFHHSGVVGGVVLEVYRKPTLVCFGEAYEEKILGLGHLDGIQVV